VQGAVDDQGAGRHDVMSALRDLALFSDLAPEQLDDLARGSRLVRLDRDGWLFHPGDPGSSMFAVVSGRLEVVTETSHRPEVVRVVTRGGLIGELSQFTNEPRTSAVRAVHESELVELDRDAFLRTLWRSPGTAVLFGALASRRLDDRVLDRIAGREPVRQLGVVALDDAVPLAELAAILATAVGQRVGLMYESESPPARMSARETLAEYSRLLTHHALADQHVLLLDDRRGTNPLWSSFVVQRADAVLAIATPGARVPPEVARDLRGCHLVLLGSPSAFEMLPSLLDAVQPRAHHFVRSNDRPGALDRVARRVLGRSLGVVLSGGGAAALAHIGALQALDEAGLRIDSVGGCSMGAFLGAMHALGMGPSDMAETCRRELVRGRPFSDYTVPRHSLIKGRRAEAMLRRVFGDAEIERLETDYFCVSADLLTAELVVHRRGALWETVGISMSVPGLAPPRPWNGRLLVDGGILDNLPIDVMAEGHEGPIVAVDVIGRRLAASANPEGGGARRAQPGIGETLVQSMVLGSHHRISQTKHLADLVIAPDVSRVALLEFGRLDEAIEAGRTAARRALEANPALVDAHALRSG
jgi:NTE family protein